MEQSSTELKELRTRNEDHKRTIRYLLKRIEKYKTRITNLENPELTASGLGEKERFWRELDEFL